MKINSIGNFFAGVLLCLLVVFFVKPSFLVSSSEVDEKSNVDQKTEHADLIEENTLPKKNKSCDEACVLAVIERLKTGQDLKNEYGANVSDIQGLNTGKYLADKPELISEIEASLAKINSQSERNSILLVLRQLPVAQTLEVAKRLMASDFGKAKIDGLNMLSRASKKGVDVREQMAAFIQNSKDVPAVFTAFKVLQTNYPEDFERISAERLDKILADTSNGEDQGRALAIKVKYLPINDAIKNDIIYGLNSKSADLQKKAIISFGRVLSKQREIRDSSFDWRKDTKLRALIDGIIIDKNGDLHNKRDAINLLIRHY